VGAVRRTSELTVVLFQRRENVVITARIRGVTTFFRRRKISAPSSCAFRDEVAYARDPSVVRVVQVACRFPLSPDASFENDDVQRVVQSYCHSPFVKLLMCS